MTDVKRLINDKIYLKNYLINAIEAAIANFDVIITIVKYIEFDIKSIEDKKEFLNGLKYKLIISYDEWIIIIIKELLESLYINKRFINSLMDTFEHENSLLLNISSEYYYREGSCTVSPITYCIIKKKIKLFIFKRLIGINEIHSFKLEKVNVCNNTIIERIELITEKYKFTKT